MAAEFPATTPRPFMWYREAAELGSAEGQLNPGPDVCGGPRRARGSGGSYWLVPGWRRARETPRLSSISASPIRAARAFPPDDGVAAHWFMGGGQPGKRPRRSSISGSCTATAMGVLQTKPRPARWLRKAAGHDYPGARSGLASLDAVDQGAPLFNGKGMPRLTSTS